MRREKRGPTIDRAVMKAVTSVRMGASEKTGEGLGEMNDFPGKWVLPKLTQEGRKGKLKYTSYQKSV